MISAESSDPSACIRVDRRGVGAIRPLHDLAGEVAGGVIAVGGSATVAGLNHLEGDTAVAMRLHNARERAGGVVAVMFGRVRLTLDVEKGDVPAAIGMENGRHRLGAGGVVIVDRRGAVAADDFGRIQRSIRMHAGDGDDLAGRIEMLILRGVRLAGDVVGPVVLGMIGVDDIGGRLHTGSVNCGRVGAVGLLHGLTGEVACSVIGVGRLGAVAALN